MPQCVLTVRSIPDEMTLFQVPQWSKGEGVLREGLRQPVHQQRGLCSARGGVHLWTSAFLAGGRGALLAKGFPLAQGPQVWTI